MKRIFLYLLARLVFLPSYPLMWFGDKLKTLGRKIAWCGYRCRDKSFMISPEVHKVHDPEEAAKDAIIAVQVKRGGCEVQTGCFRRVDCGGTDWREVE